MSNLDTVIDFGSKNLRLGVYDQSSEIIYHSSIEATKASEIESLDKSLNKLIRDAEKQLSTHLVDVNVLYDSSEFNFIDLSIKKSFDHPLKFVAIVDGKEKVLHVPGNFDQNSLNFNVVRFSIKNMEKS